MPTTRSHDLTCHVRGTLCMIYVFFVFVVFYCEFVKGLSTIILRLNFIPSPPPIRVNFCSRLLEVLFGNPTNELPPHRASLARPLCAMIPVVLAAVALAAHPSNRISTVAGAKRRGGWRLFDATSHSTLGRLRVSQTCAIYLIQ